MLGMPIWINSANKKEIIKIEHIIFEIACMAVCFFKTTGNLLAMHDMR